MSRNLPPPRSLLGSARDSPATYADDPYTRLTSAAGFPFDCSLPLYFSARLPRETAANECAYHKLLALACERASVRRTAHLLACEQRTYAARMQRRECCISIPRARRLEMIGSERRAPGKLFGASRRVPPVKPVGTESDGPSYPPVQAAALSGLQTFTEKPEMIYHDRPSGASQQVLSQLVVYRRVGEGGRPR